ncbi:MAG: lysophospholipid acyltransferase family protein [Oceanobacter sp.]
MKTLSGLLIIGLIRLMSLLPLSWAQAFGRLLGTLLGLYRNRSREVARVNLNMVYPDMPEPQRQALLKETLRQNGMVAAEMGTFWGRSPERCLSLIRQVHNPELLQEAVASDQGLLVLAPHIGNWELLNTYLMAHTQMTIMYKPAKNPVFDQWMRQRRESSGSKLVPTTAGGVRSLFKTLQRGETAGFLPDQEPERRSGVMVPFMDVPTLTPRMPFELLQRTKAKALMVFAVRLPNSAGFDIHLMEPDADIYSSDPMIASEALNRSVERVVATASEQYQWTYKRFKRQPDGVSNPYRVAGVP